MAAITPQEGIDLKGLYAHLAAQLPAYARPIFLRLQGEVETTGTLKYRKVDLVTENFDPSKTSDPLYVVDVEQGTYVPIDAAMFTEIMGGSHRF